MLWNFDRFAMFIRNPGDVTEWDLAEVREVGLLGIWILGAEHASSTHPLEGKSKPAYACKEIDKGELR